MRNRGTTFWRWAEALMPTRTYQEILKNGGQIDVQTRLSRTGGTQLFIGVYDQAGKMVVEEIYVELPGQTMTKALLFGTQRARTIGLNGVRKHTDVSASK